MPDKWEMLKDQLKQHIIDLQAFGTGPEEMTEFFRIKVLAFLEVLNAMRVLEIAEQNFEDTVSGSGG